MIITLDRKVSSKQKELVIRKIRELGFQPHISSGIQRTVIGVIGENAILAREIFEAMDGVEFITPISQPFKLASRDFHPKNSVVALEDIRIGGKEIVIMAGPCAVEGEKEILEIAEAVKKSGNPHLHYVGVN